MLLITNIILISLLSTHLREKKKKPRGCTTSNSCKVAIAEQI